MPPKTIAVANRKGGVGKTTTAVNCAAVLADPNAPRKKVLLLDMDPQGNATTHLMRTEERGEGGDSGMYEVLCRGQRLASEALCTDWGFAFVPGGEDLTVAEIRMTTATSGRGRFVLKEAIDELADSKRFDLIIIDCPPSLGALTHAALIAADAVLAPIALEPFPLEGFHQLMNLIATVRKYDNAKLQLGAVLVTKTNPRTRVATLVAGELEGTPVLDQHPIRINTDLAAAAYAKKPVIHHAPGSHGAEDYAAACDELIKRGVF